MCAPGAASLLGSTLTGEIPEVMIVKKSSGSRVEDELPPLSAGIEWFEKKRVDPEPLISAVYPFEKSTAFRGILDKPENF